MHRTSGELSFDRRASPCGQGQTGGSAQLELHVPLARVGAEQPQCGGGRTSPEGDSGSSVWMTGEEEMRDTNLV